MKFAAWMLFTGYLPFCAACSTTNQDVAKAEADAEVETTTAYNDADEKALAAEHDADEKALAIDAETNAKVDKAYAEAESKEAKAERKVAETRRAAFVDATQKFVADRRKEIEALKAPPHATPTLKAQAEVLETSVKTIENRLELVKASNWRTWETPRAGVEQAVAFYQTTYQKSATPETVR